MTIPIKELSAFEQPAIERHFVSLTSEDRRLRFGAGLNDYAVRLYVKRIDFERDALFGVMDDELNIVAAAHLARTNGHAEFGVSVLPGHRDRGIGGALLRRAHMHARNWGVHALFTHCLTENGAMMHLAKAGHGHRHRGRGNGGLAEVAARRRLELHGRGVRATRCTFRLRAEEPDRRRAARRRRRHGAKGATGWRLISQDAITTLSASTAAPRQHAPDAASRIWYIARITRYQVDVNMHARLASRFPDIH